MKLNSFTSTSECIILFISTTTDPLVCSYPRIVSKWSALAVQYVLFVRWYSLRMERRPGLVALS
jgi:hypothetical protein